MRFFLGLTVFGLAIAGVNHCSMPLFSMFSSQSVTAGVLVDRSLSDRQIAKHDANTQRNFTETNRDLESTQNETVSSYPSLFWNFKNLPTISYSQLLDVLARQPDSTREIAAQPEDIARFERIVQYAKRQNLPDRPLGEIVQAIADNFLGKPYAEGLLDKSGEEKLVITLDRFDCVLFVETVLAIARGVAVKDYEYQNFVDRIESQRYLNGKMNGYCSRLHYFSAWINDNQKRQTVDNITAQLGGMPMHKKLNFMSQNRSSYPQMIKDKATYQCIIGVEADLAKSIVNYIPENRIKSVYSQLKPGDIVAVATDVKGLDVTHTGLVYRNADGNIGLIHASPAGQVTVAYDLHRYISRVESAIGIVVARPIDPRYRGNKIQRESMSLSEQKIDSFIELLTQQRSLYSPEQLTELAELIEPLSDEIDVLSAAIATWLENYPAIGEAQAKLLEPLTPSNASETVSQSSGSSGDKVGDRLNKQALKNAILL